MLVVTAVRVVLVVMADFAVSAEPPKDFTNSIGMKFKLITAGEFMLGSSESPAQRPQRQVRITRPFYLCAFNFCVPAFCRLLPRSTSVSTLLAR